MVCRKFQECCNLGSDLLGPVFPGIFTSFLEQLIRTFMHKPELRLASQLLDIASSVSWNLQDREVLRHQGEFNSVATLFVKDSVFASSSYHD